MILRLITAPQRWMGCLEPLTLDAPPCDRSATHETAETVDAVETAETCAKPRALGLQPMTEQLRAVAEGRRKTAPDRAERGLQAAEAAQARGESIWPWLDALPGPPGEPQARRWAALVQRDAGAVPERLQNTNRVRLWFNAAWQATDQAPGLARWLAERAPCLPVVPSLFAGLTEQVETAAVRAALGALFMRLSPQGRADLLSDGTPACLSGTAREVLVERLPAACHSAVAQAWLLHRRSAFVSAHSVPLLRPLNDSLLKYSLQPRDYHGSVELELVAFPTAPPQTGLPPWTQPLLAPASGSAEHAQVQRAMALGRFLFACRVAAVPEPTRDAAAPLVAALLALPDDELRRELLWSLAGALTLPDRAAAVLVLAQAKDASPKTLPLRLAAQGLSPALPQEPGFKELLTKACLGKDGEEARSIMRLILSEKQAAYAGEVLALTRPAHVRRVVDGPAQALAVQAALKAAQSAVGASGHARSAALAQLDRHQAEARALSAARRDLPPPGAGAEAPAPLLGALHLAFTWLAGLPGLGEAAGPAAKLCTARALRGPAFQAALSQCETALKAQRARAAGWEATWCASLLGDLRSLSPSAGARPLPAYPSPAVRAVLKRQVKPLLLKLAEYAPLVQDAGRAPHTFAHAQEVLPACLQWSGLPPRALRALALRCPDLHNMALYQASMRHWSARERSRGEALLKMLLKAMASGRLDAVRRQGAQARQLARQPGGEALLQGWEQCAPTGLDGRPPLPTDPPAATIADTGEPPSVLAAVTDIRSCQSARDGMFNQGMLSRLSDGAKRMVMLRDAGGKLRARAMLRLMLTPGGRPVLLLSPLYYANGADEGVAERAVHDHVRRRAAELGVQAVCTESTQPLPAAQDLSELKSESAPRDYWDELSASNATGPISFMCTLRQIAPPPMG